ncbi:MAG: hypothetical protein LBG97_07040, partial [Coriobacteriales bacterium]|nr:hypothetical protein [Coriobacteriales bacterium]
MSQTFKHSLIIFFAGCCYGFVVPLVRVAYSLGLTPQQTSTTQYVYSLLTLAIIVLIGFRRKIPLKAIPKLLLIGVAAAGVSMSYYMALELLSAATALTLLFQFVWMGVLWQAIRERKLPRTITLVSVFVILIGTLFATEIIGGNNTIGSTSD